MTLAFTMLPSPVGELTLVAGDAGLVAILWEEEEGEGRVPLGPMVRDEAHPILTKTVRQLTAYFAGGRTTFDVPLDPRGTDFQQAVWQALRAIPFGETRSYAEIARAIGKPDAVRAVGAANGRNPISIIVPCHRVIGSGGALTGFAGGLAAKRFLLGLEAGAGELFSRSS